MLILLVKFFTRNTHIVTIIILTDIRAVLFVVFFQNYFPFPSPTDRSIPLSFTGEFAVLQPLPDSPPTFANFHGSCSSSSSFSGAVGSGFQEGRGEMSAAAYSFIQLWQVPSSRLFLRTSVMAQDMVSTSRMKFCQTSSFSTMIQMSSCEIRNDNQMSGVGIDNTSKMEKTFPAQIETLGAFQTLPMVMPSSDIISSALKKAKKVPPTKGIANIAKRERNRGAKQIDALMKELAVPLRNYVTSFPNKRHLHPYERALLELTLGDGNYEEVLKSVDNLRKKIVSVGKEHASLCAKCSTKKEAEDRLSEGMQRIEDIYRHQKKALDDLLDIAKSLRAMPVVDLHIPTLCLVGAPNVGKSSLVRVLSTGKPEICNYPFTTRGILMGHIVFNLERFQVTDTPGLLTRPDDDRNNLEKLTLAVLQHLPTAVLFVHDLSGECGTKPSDQFITYKELKQKFNNHLWLDVVSKCDILEPKTLPSGDCGNDDNLDLTRYLRHGPEDAIHVSVMSGQGLAELKDKVHELLMRQLSKIKSGDGDQDGSRVA